MFKYLELTIIGALCLLLGFSGAAHAAAAIDPADGTTDLLGAVYSALTGGHYAYVACMALVAAVALARKSLGAKVPWLHTNVGSAVLVLVGTFGATMASALLGGGPVTLSAAENALGIAFAAAGGYSAVKTLVIQPLLPKLPSWMQPIVGYLFFHASDPGNIAPPAAVVVSTAPAATKDSK